MRGIPARGGEDGRSSRLRGGERKRERREGEKGAVGAVGRGQSQREREREREISKIRIQTEKHVLNSVRL